MHIPVLKDEVLHFLNPNNNENFIDCTAGLGGHSYAILKKIKPDGKLLALEWDNELCEILSKKKNKRFIVVNDSYTRLKETVERLNFSSVKGVLFDLGFSSFHVDKSKRGFSFMRDEELDMRYNKNNLLTAKDIVNNEREKNLIYILEKYSDEDYAKKIAEKIIERRKEKRIETTKELANIIESAVPSSYKREKIHFATRTFQAIRIAVNGELLGLPFALKQALDVLEKEGRMVVICFHGGEEKIVTRFFRNNRVKIITPKAITPSKEEVKKNIRSRSAKLYAIIKK